MTASAFEAHALVNACEEHELIDVLAQALRQVIDCTQLPLGAHDDPIPGRPAPDALAPEWVRDVIREALR